MNYLQVTDYDQKIREFISCWEEDNDFRKKSFKIALTGILIPYIYKIIREEKLSGKEIKRRKYFFSRLKNIKEVLNHLTWYILWSIKWLLFISLKKNGRRIILASFFPKNATSFEYIRTILNRNRTDHFFLVNFSVIYNMKYLFNSRLFCYPHFFYKKKEIHTEEYYLLEKDFKALFEKYFKIEFSFYLTEYIKSFNTVYNSFSYLVEMIQRDNKILCFVQDCDYLNDRVLFSNYCKTKNIPSLAFDHSIQIYDHLFYNNFSDYRITWGEYQINRITKLSNNIPKKLINGGRPGYYFSFKTINYQKNKVWIYLLPAFQEANMQSIHRSLQQTENNIINIKKIISENYKSVKLLVKPHPSDEREIFQFTNDLVNDSLDILMNETQLAFVEDSTISLELLKYEIPVVYFADKLNNDNLHLRELNSDYIFVSSKESLGIKIPKALNKKIDHKEREKIFSYYFGEGKNFENNLNELLDEIFAGRSFT